MRGFCSLSALDLKSDRFHFSFIGYCTKFSKDQIIKTDLELSCDGEIISALLKYVLALMCEKKLTPCTKQVVSDIEN